MKHVRFLPEFRLHNGEDCGRPFDDFLADRNVIMLTHVAEASHNPASELIRSLVAQHRRANEASVRGFDIRSLDGFCDRCCEPHLVSEESGDLLTICDSGGLIRLLWGVESDAWCLFVDANRNVLIDGPLTEIDRLAMQFRLDLALSPHRIARAPPDQQDAAQDDTAA